MHTFCSESRTGFSQANIQRKHQNQRNARCRKPSHKHGHTSSATRHASESTPTRLTKQKHVHFEYWKRNVHLDENGHGKIQKPWGVSKTNQGCLKLMTRFTHTHTCLQVLLALEPSHKQKTRQNIQTLKRDITTNPYAQCMFKKWLPNAWFSVMHTTNNIHCSTQSWLHCIIST